MKTYFWAEVIALLSIWASVNVAYGQNPPVVASQPASAPVAQPASRPAGDAAPTPTATTDERIRRLEERQGWLEAALTAEEEADRQQLASTPVVKAGKDGFWIKSPDDAYSLRLGGYVQADGRFISGDDISTTTNDTFLLRRLRPIIEGTVARDFDYRIMLDFGQGQTSVQDAYVEWKKYQEAKVRVGKQKVPFGLEQWQSDTDTRFAERALPTNLVPNRDLGALFNGELGKGWLTYYAGIFDGTPDGGSNDTDIDGSKELVARLFAHPFKNSGKEFLEGLGVGGAVTYGNESGNSSSSYLPTYKTPAQQTFFKYRSDALADGSHVRVSPQAYYYYKSFGLMGEWVQSSQDVALKGKSDRIDNTGWQVTASYLLTGEKASFKGVDPIKPFEPGKGGRGAWEIAARYSHLDIGGNAFPTYADPSKSAGSAKAFGVGVNWYLNKNMKVMLDYERTACPGGSPQGDRDDEHAAFVRFQVSF